MDCHIVSECVGLMTNVPQWTGSNSQTSCQLMSTVFPAHPLRHSMFYVEYSATYINKINDGLDAMLGDILYMTECLIQWVCWKLAKTAVCACSV